MIKNKVGREKAMSCAVDLSAPRCLSECSCLAFSQPPPLEIRASHPSYFHSSLQLPNNPVSSLIGRRSGWRLIDGITTPLRLIRILRWLKLDPGLLASEVARIASIITVIALIRRRVWWSCSWRRLLVKLVATVVRLGRRSMAWGRSSTGPSGTAVGNKPGATSATSGDTTTTIFQWGVFRKTRGGQIREEEEEQEAGTNQNGDNNPSTIGIPIGSICIATTVSSIVAIIVAKGKCIVSCNAPRCGFAEFSDERFDAPELFFAFI